MDKGERSLTIDEIPLDWCFNDGVLLTADTTLVTTGSGDVTLAVAVVLLAGLTLLASLLPATRAARVDPASVLRHE